MSLYSKPWLSGIDYVEMAGGQDNVPSVTQFKNGLNPYLHDFEWTSIVIYYLW